jgi:outer membrane protein assembly factor BamE (lipoprotein component of BamABCDE complex)
MKKFEKTSKILAVLAFMLLTAGCVKSTKLVGYTNEGAKFNEIQVGKATKSTITNDFGSPSSVSTYGDEIWYYISTEQENVAFFTPKIKSQNVVAIAFSGDTVKSVNQYNKNDAQKVKISSDYTKTDGQDAGVLGQLLGNVGRFNKDRRDPIKQRSKP